MVSHSSALRLPVPSVRRRAWSPSAPPFIDFREEIAKLPHDQQVAVIGASAYKLLDAGVVKWTDVVTESRVRTLREVVSLKDLSVKTLTAAGVRPRIALAAHAAVNTPSHVAADAARRAGLAQLQAAGLKQDALVAELSARVSVAEGATYTTKSGEVLSGVSPIRWLASRTDVRGWRAKGPVRTTFLRTWSRGGDRRGVSNKLGVVRMELSAARNDNPKYLQVGYSVWPKFGFDGPLEPGRAAALPPSLAGAWRLSDLLATPEGRDWWEKHGWSIHLEFDMTPGSRSWQTWRADVERKRSSR